MSKYPEYFQWKNVLWDPLYEKKKSPIDNKDQKTRVAAYCRVSVKREDGYKSLENQVSYYTQFIKSQKNYRLVGVYFDFGISAVSSDKRNGFKRLIRHCKEERIDLILTKSVSRFSRNSKELLEVVKQLTELGITIYFERENIDTSRDYNSFIFSVQAAIAQDEIETASQLCKYGYEKKLIQGKPNFRNPYGYDVNFKDGETIVTINEAEAKVVKWIYQQFLQGKTYAEINRELIQNGIKTKKGNSRWESTVVKKILTSVVYIGNKLARSRTKDFLTGKIKKTTDREQYLITNTHPAIITEDVFNLAQERVKKVGKKSHNNNNKQRKRAFSKRIICGRCEKRYRAQYNTKWDCPNALPSVNLCKAKRLSDNELKEMALKAFQERFNTLTELLKILQHINQNDHFEFHRLKMLTEIEILKSQGLDIAAKREEYAKFEERFSKIEADRTYRDQAINWLASLKNIDEFRDEITVELIRAWVMEIAVYSKDAFIIKWIDEKETVIGEAEIEEIKKEITEQEIISTIELNHKLPIQLEQIEAALQVSTREEVKNMAVEAHTEEVQNEVIKLEPGMGIAAVKNLKKSLSKAKALNILSKNDKKLKVAAYCRVSTLEGQQQVSLQTQIAYYTYLILKNPQWEFAGIYADKGLSGTSTEHREEFNKMIEAAKAGKIDLIITKSISRFSRNVVDVLEVIKTLKELPNPTQCYFEKENINSADKEATMLITLMGAVAENEVMNLSKNIRWGITKLAQRGIIHKTTNIYGYHIDKDRNWEIVPEEAEVIRFIAKEYVSGSRYKNIIQKLHAKGIKSPSGKAYWNDHQIR
ncbi:DNA invertase Pin-like site-specific DNA recombinase, partial [Desulfitispora alkaliphila]|uniref:recombinase family protein n=1 Tax=Desulfitispora alkaliphila TaxID=622674 RepID=UPI003D1ED2E1